MSAEAEAAALRRRTGRWRGYRRAIARARYSPRLRLTLVLVAITLAGVIQLRWQDHVPRSIYGPCVLVAGLFLTPGALLISFAWIGIFLVVNLISSGGPTSGVSALFAFGTLGFLMAVMYHLSNSRAGLGISGTSGDRMLHDLHVRQRQLAKLPSLPHGWHAESSIAGAHGDRFAGDFLLSTLSDGGDRLEAALVDVSGHGLRAGTRSLMLSSALSGLLGQVAPERFLSAANTYLVRQQWREGFATAVHVAVDLREGTYVLSRAGHPPAVQFHAGTATWSAVDAGGPVLGVMDGMSFPMYVGRLEPGDALIAYTDGVIETRGQELADGIDWLLGAADRERGEGFAGVAAALSGQSLGGESDDRAVLVVWRGRVA